MTRPNKNFFPVSNGSKPSLRPSADRHSFTRASKGGDQMLQGLCTWVVTHMRTMRNEEGATAVEYGLMVALIAAVIVATVALLGDEIHEIGRASCRERVERSKVERAGR